MELTLIVNPSIHEIRDTLDKNIYLFTYYGNEKVKTDDNLV